MLKFFKFKKKEDKKKSSQAAKSKASPKEITKPAVQTAEKINTSEQTAKLKIAPSKEIVNDYRPSSSKQSVLAKLQQGLKKTKQAFNIPVKEEINWQEIEDVLLKADLGFKTTSKLLEQLQDKSNNSPSTDFVVKNVLKDLLKDMLSLPTAKAHDNKKKQCILVVGVNGTGKTTTVAKLTHLHKQSQKKLLLVAGDTFRAAAENQLKVWAKRNKVPIVEANGGRDPSALVFRGLEQASNTDTELVIVDTAGRLHTQINLMEELKKIKRVADKFAKSIEIKVIMVLDASLGQNSVSQLQQFNEAVKVDELIVTKLDGTAKGGIIFSLYEQFAKPVSYIGVGEKIEDLLSFDAEQFISSIID